jgi:hypothetical protein
MPPFVMLWLWWIPCLLSVPRLTVEELCKLEDARRCSR